MDDKIKVTVRKRDGVVFDEDAWAVSSVNDIGPFDILPNHANFICTIKEKLTVHQNKNSQKDYPLENGILRVKENLVEVFLGI